MTLLSNMNENAHNATEAMVNAIDPYLRPVPVVGLVKMMERNPEWYGFPISGDHLRRYWSAAGEAAAATAAVNTVRPAQ